MIREYCIKVEREREKREREKREREREKRERDLFGEEPLQLPVGGEQGAVRGRARAAAAAAPGGQRGERVGVERGLVERQTRVDVRRALRVVVHEEHHRRPVEARVPAGRQRARALREAAQQLHEVAAVLISARQRVPYVFIILYILVHTLLDTLPHACI